MCDFTVRVWVALYGIYARSYNRVAFLFREWLRYSYTEYRQLNIKLCLIFKLHERTLVGEVFALCASSLPHLMQWHVCQSRCALPGSRKFDLKFPTGARTRGHNFRTFLWVYLTSFVPSHRPPTVHRDHQPKICGAEKKKMGKCKRIRKFLGRFLCCSKSAMKDSDSD